MAGRRPLLMISGLVMTVSMGSLALYLNYASSVPESWRWLPLVSIIGSFIGYSVGYATIPFCIMGEMLPVRLVAWSIVSPVTSCPSYSEQGVSPVLYPPQSTWPACSWCWSSTPPWQTSWATLVFIGKNLISSFILFIPEFQVICWSQLRWDCLCVLLAARD